MVLQTVTSANDALKKRVEAVLDMAVTTASSLSQSFAAGVPVMAEEAGLAKEKTAELEAIAERNGPE